MRKAPCLVDVSPPILPPALSALHAPGLGSRPALTQTCVVGLDGLEVAVCPYAQLLGRIVVADDYSARMRLQGRYGPLVVVSALYGMAYCARLAKPPWPESSRVLQTARCPRLRLWPCAAPCRRRRRRIANWPDACRGVRVLTLVREPSDEKGSLKAMCPSSPTPPHEQIDAPGLGYAALVVGAFMFEVGGVAVGYVDILWTYVHVVERSCAA